jgi:trehalose-6-phosphate synthase
MRDAVEKNNVYRWAGKFISELANIEFPETVEQEISGFASQSEKFRTAALSVAV